MGKLLYDPGGVTLTSGTLSESLNFSVSGSVPEENIATMKHGR